MREFEEVKNQINIKIEGNTAAFTFPSERLRSLFVSQALKLFDPAAHAAMTKSLNVTK